ncbi:MAG: FAD-dependent oxidoreductase, partial [Robiginitalea sp.]
NREREFRTANCIWTAGVTGALPAGFPEDALEDRSGRLLVDRYNRVKGMENVFALGDIALMKTPDYPNGHPQVAQSAIQQGKWLGRNLRRHFKGKAMQPFTYRNKGTMATIGRNKAVVDFARGSFAGFMAWFVWMFVHLMALVGFRNKVVVFFNWLYNYINYDKATRLIVRPYRRFSDK